MTELESKEKIASGYRAKLNDIREKISANRAFQVLARIYGNSVFRYVLKILIALEILTLGLMLFNATFQDEYSTWEYFVGTSGYYHGEIWSELIAEFTITEAILAAMPILVTALGATFNEQAGVINIGLEGIMLFSAWFAVYIILITGSIWIAVIMAVIAGGLMGFLHALFTISFKAEQIVTGVAINLLALGLVRVFSIMLWNSSYKTHEITVAPFKYLEVPVLGDILSFFSFSQYSDGGILQFIPDPIIIFSEMDVFIWIAIFLIPILHTLLFKTSFGLRIRVVGEHPQAAATAGIPVRRYQYYAVIISGLLAGFGGSMLTVILGRVFRDTTVGGRGFIALAAMIYGKWTIRGSAMAALLFGYFFALSSFLPIGVSGFIVPAPLFNTIPYIIAIFALAGFIGKARPPKAIGKPYDPSSD